QASRQADDDREQHGGNRQLDGGGKQLAEFPQDRLARRQRLAQIAMENLADIVGVLHQHRTVEAELMAQQFMARRIDAVLAGEQLDGVARYQANDEKRQQRDADESRHN